MPKIKLDGYSCLRCEHRWVPRDDTIPTVCPKCKSPYWDKPKKNSLNSEKSSEKER